MSQVIYTNQLNAIFSKLNMIRQRGYFDEHTYPEIDQLVDEVADMKKNGHLNQTDLLQIQHYFGQDFLENTLHGMALLKKYGYAGDFLMIDRIYTGNPGNDLFNLSWDNYFQNHAAPRAVRNRKNYFKHWVKKNAPDLATVRLLNVASGPGRDLLELYQEINSDKQLQTTCIEMDENAIAYAGQLLNGYQSRVQFIHRNIFKFDTEEKFDLIWSAGLFDYFDDKAFLYVLKKFRKWLSPGGRIAIGNFNQDHNPSRNYMELFGEWYLHHRSEAELINLALEAGYEPEQISIQQEPEKVNLFLNIKG